MVRRITAFGIGVLVALGLPIVLVAQGGGVAGQIQAALRNFTASANTWTGTQTFANITVNGTCTGCGGGGSVSLTGTAPIVLTPSPTTGTGVVSCATCVTFAGMASPPAMTAFGSSMAPYTDPYFTGKVTVSTATNSLIYTPQDIDISGPSLAIFSGSVSGNAQIMSTMLFPSAPHLEEPFNGARELVNGNQVDIRVLGVDYDNSDLINMAEVGMLWANTDSGLIILSSFAGPIRFATGGAALSKEFLRLNDSGVFGFGPFPTISTMDLGVYRSAAGVLEVNNGTPGTVATIKANVLIPAQAAPMGQHCTLQISDTGAITKTATCS